MSSKKIPGCETLAKGSFGEVLTGECLEELLQQEGVVAYGNFYNNNDGKFYTDPLDKELFKLQLSSLVVKQEFSNNNEKNFEETDFIFSKFKKISEPLTEPNAIVLQPDASITIQQLYNKILEMEERMNAKHAEIMACLNVSACVMQNQFNQ